MIKSKKILTVFLLLFLVSPVIGVGISRMEWPRIPPQPPREPEDITSNYSATFIVAKGGKGNFDNVQEAVDNLPETGGKIVVREGNWTDQGVGIYGNKHNIIIEGMGDGTEFYQSLSTGKPAFTILGEKTDVWSYLTEDCVPLILLRDMVYEWDLTVESTNGFEVDDYVLINDDMHRDGLKFNDESNWGGEVLRVREINNLTSINVLFLPADNYFISLNATLTKLLFPHHITLKNFKVRDKVWEEGNDRYGQIRLGACGFIELSDITFVGNTYTAVGLGWRWNPKWTEHWYAPVIDSIITHCRLEYSQHTGGGRGYGITLCNWGTQRNLITNNICRDGTHGLSITNKASFNTYDGNMIYGTPGGGVRGILLGHGTGSKFNIVSNNIIQSGKDGGIGMGSSHNNTIIGNTIYNYMNGPAININYGSGNSIIGNKIIGGGSGVSLGYYCEDTIIMGNSFFTDGLGVYSLGEGVKNLTIIGNILPHKTGGSGAYINLINADGVTIIGNDAYGEKYEGFVLTNVTNVIISDNRIRSHRANVELNLCKYIHIKDNQIRTSQTLWQTRPIYIIDSQYIYISGNEIVGADYYGVESIGASDYIHLFANVIMDYNFGAWNLTGTHNEIEHNIVDW